MLKREEQATRFVGDTKAVRGIAGRVPVRVPTPTPDLGYNPLERFPVCISDAQAPRALFARRRFTMGRSHIGWFGGLIRTDSMGSSHEDAAGRLLNQS